METDISPLTNESNGNPENLDWNQLRQIQAGDNLAMQQSNLAP
jgi:hypothetical protein